MKVLFEAFWWGSGPISNRQVQRAMIREWVSAYPEDEVTIAARRKDIPLIVSEFGDRVRTQAVLLAPQAVSSIVELPRLVKKSGADVVISHNFASPGTKSVVFIHDVLFMTNPEWFTWLERGYFNLMPWSARSARLILTSSESEAERIKRCLGARREAEVRAVGLALNDSLLSAQPAGPVGNLRPRQFVLAVGRLNARKNVATACMAALDARSITAARPLVVVGSPQGKGVELPESVQEAVSDGSIVFTGHVTNEQLAWLYANTALFLFVSLGEGFGLPPLEAMAFGAPVVAADIPVMREVLGHYATFVDPKDRAAISAAIDGHETARGTRQSRIEMARTKYSWQDTVRQMRTDIATSEMSKGGRR